MHRKEDFASVANASGHDRRFWHPPLNPPAGADAKPLLKAISYQLNANAQSWRHHKLSSDLRCMVLLVLMSSGALCAAGEPLTIKSEDLLLEVGTKRITAFAADDGKYRGEQIEIVTESTKLGDAVVTKYGQIVDGRRMPDTWSIITPRQFQVCVEGNTKTPFLEFDLPMRVGLAGRVSPETGASTARVEREERITVPAGTFDCLVFVTEKDKQPLVTVWQAPRVGVVQMKASNRYTAVLMAIQKPTLAAADPDTKLLCNFDSGDPLSSPLFPKGRWKTGFGTDKTNVICSIEIDLAEAALGTPMSLRWRYHIKGNPWIQADFPLTGSSQEKVDVTIYDSISFYIKGFKPGGCLFMVHSQPVRQGDDGYVNIPVDYTTEWKKVTIDLRASALSRLDLTKTTQISFGHLGQGDDANVVWIDEMTCHLKKASAATEGKAKTN